MQYTCPECEVVADASRLSPPRFAVDCGACGGSVHFKEDGEHFVVSGYMPPAVPTKLDVRIDVPPPKKHGDRLSSEMVGEFEASFRWFDRTVIVLIAFVILVGGFFGALYQAIPISTLEFSFGALIAGVVVLVFALAEVGLTWFIVCILFNRSIVRIKNQQLTIGHGPVPSIKAPINLSLPAIEMFVVASTANEGEDPTTSWNIEARLHDGPSHVLLSNTSQDIAQFLAWRLTHQLV